ncbi:PKD domain-containing protein [Aeromicrobium duanguangcaii]|uniref:PKD domain-containing protein n=1 Tax=Aeromicrobium duanguangcaii TaxID=2968086 RepID=A0ABY5KBC4_9ACTN|nr:PKD domain-containing protein [Aeromicrobium duanguangcaii]MCD9154985.1 PKD domain-containing protein [Aeromicrobium duanguangcaii]MCL3838974.1 PKD domain-containing protein [Aeromicrobium duanguangcaii]UUI67610.1 PKD domain-containing protein [Aeromicrobium duanguangcaii]
MATHALFAGLRTLRQGLSASALALVIVLGTAVASHADPDWTGENTGGGTDVGGVEDGQNGTPGGTPGVGGGTKISIPGPWTQRIYVPACDANSVRATGPGVSDYETVGDVLCTHFEASCPGDGTNRWYVYERPMGADNRATRENFTSEGTVCRSRPDPSESEPPTITVGDIMDKARALAPTPTFVIEPAAKSYVNVPTNFAANVEPVTVNVVVLGFTIPVDFVPGDVTWSFGDGTSDTGLGVRNASVGQADAVEHAYTRSGDYNVGVTVGYTARINVPNGEPIVMPTPISRTAAPQALTVGEIQSVVTEVD